MYEYVSKNKQLPLFQNYFGVLSLKRCFLISSVICMGKITLCQRQNVAHKLQIKWPRYILCFRDINIRSQLQDFYTIYILTICIIHCCLHITFYATTHHLSTRRLLHIFYAIETCPQQDMGYSMLDRHIHKKSTRKLLRLITLTLTVDG